MDLNTIPYESKIFLLHLIQVRQLEFGIRFLNGAFCELKIWNWRKYRKIILNSRNLWNIYCDAAYNYTVLYYISFILIHTTNNANNKLLNDHLYNETIHAYQLLYTCTCIYNILKGVEEVYLFSTSVQLYT